MRRARWAMALCLLLVLGIGLLRIFLRGRATDDIFIRRVSPPPASNNAAVPLVLLVLGDFGVDPKDPVFAADFAKSQQVLTSLDTTAKAYVAAGHDLPRLLLTGDLIYPSGIQSKQDFWRMDHLFSASRLGKTILRKLDTFAVAGNHDCEGEISTVWPLIQESALARQWKRASRQHALFGETRFKTRWGTTVRLISLETCSLVCSGSNNAEGNFRCAGENMSKYAINPEFASLRAKQLEYLRNNVEPKRAGEWLIVMGHFPVYSFRGNGPTRELADLLLGWMRNFRVDAYLSGHDHALQEISGTNLADPVFLVSGAGGYPLHFDLKRDADAGINTNAARLVHVQDEAGFMALEVYAQELKIKFINAWGGVTYETSIKRK